MDKTRVEKLLVKEGYKLRLKRIGGREYAYAQKGRKYSSLGPYEQVRRYVSGIQSHKKRAIAVEQETQALVKQGPRSSQELFSKLREEYKNLEDEASVDVSKIHLYVGKVISRRDPEVFDSFLRFKGKDTSLEDVVGKALELVPSFRQEVEDIVAKGKDTLPDFHDHVVGAMKNWINYSIEEKRPSKFPFGSLDPRCAKCDEQLVAFLDPNHNFDRYLFRCVHCKRDAEFSCRVCGELIITSLRDSPFILACPKCGFKSKFETTPEIRKASTKEGRLLEELIGECPHEKRLALVLEYESRPDFFCIRPGLLFQRLLQLGFDRVRANSILVLFLSEAYPEISRVALAIQMEEFGFRIPSHHEFRYMVGKVFSALHGSRCFTRVLAWRSSSFEKYNRALMC